MGWFWNWGLGQLGIVGKWGADPCTKEKNEIYCPPIQQMRFSKLVSLSKNGMTFKEGKTPDSRKESNFVILIVDILCDILAW